MPAVLAVLEALLPLVIQYLPEMVQAVREVIAGTHPDPAAVADALAKAIADRKSVEAQVKADLEKHDAEADAEVAKFHRGDS